jgi:adenylate kinase
MRLILLGAPGAGKGTQGALLAKRHNVQRIVTGDILRAAVRDDTELGREARRYMDAGELVPDHLILDMLREVLAGANGGFIMDGFPRTLEQATSLDATLHDMGLAVDDVVVLDVPDEVVVKRIAGRRSCPQCGTVYNVYFEPPSVSDVCDRCGAALVQRADDREDTVLNRMRVYRRQTQPLIEYYQDGEPNVHMMDADRPVDQVHEAINRAIVEP